MPTDNREQQRGTRPVPSVPSDVPMRDLLASCAAAEAVSKPPTAPGSGPEADAPADGGQSTEDAGTADVADAAGGPDAEGRRAA